MLENKNKMLSSFCLGMAVIELVFFISFALYGGKNNGFWVLVSGLEMLLFLGLSYFFVSLERFLRMEHRINSIEARIKLLNEKRRRQ